MLTCWGRSGTGGWTCPSLVLQQRRSRRHPSSCSERQKEWSLPPVKQRHFTQHASHDWLKLLNANTNQEGAAFQADHDVSKFWDRRGAEAHVGHVLLHLTRETNTIRFPLYNHNHASSYIRRLGHAFTMPPVYWATERSTLAAELVPHTGFASSRYLWAHSTSCSCSMPTPASTMRSGR